MANISEFREGITFKTAAGRASLKVPMAEPADLAGEVRQILGKESFESISHIVICREGRFQGILGIEKLLAAPEDCPVGDIMDREPLLVGPGLDQEKAAWHAIREKRSAVSVVDSHGKFLGLITPHQLLEVLVAEHEEDLSRLSGLMKSAMDAQVTSEEPVKHRFWHRMPWLFMGLMGALLAADFVGWFEGELQEKIALAFFIPGIVYMADAVGTQTETIVIRGISVGVPIRRIFGRELLAGLVIGMVLAVIAGPVIWWRWGDVYIAAIVALSLFAACSTATLIAMALPWLFDTLGKDPAFGSGPLATVIQDLLSILIYFYIAILLLQ